MAGFCQPSVTLLDVGAGAGRFAIPLAKRVRQVIAVDPSEAMLTQLQVAAEVEGVRNLLIVQARWEDAAVQQADLVICAHVVYPIAEIAPFLRKLDAHTLGHAFVYMRVGQVDDYVAELWQSVHGSPRLPHPDYRLLQEVLAALGIPAKLELVTFTNQVTYQDHHEALADLASRLGVDGHPEQARLLRGELERILVPIAQGVGFPARVVQGAIFWWRR